jgi:nitrite reductase/ring-hydroxylating ferredoxin subunit
MPKAAFANEAFKEVEIDFAPELGEGEMKPLKFGPKDDDKVLVVRYQGKLHSLGNYCTHLGAPMHTGVLLDDKLMCPWHTAGFSVITGAHESGPALDGLPKFEVFEKDGKHYVRIPDPLPRKDT